VLDKAEYSAFESTLNSPIVSYRTVRPSCEMLQVYKLQYVTQHHSALLSVLSLCQFTAQLLSSVHRSSLGYAT